MSIEEQYLAKGFSHMRPIRPPEAVAEEPECTELSNGVCDNLWMTFFICKMKTSFQKLHSLNLNRNYCFKCAICVSNISKIVYFCIA